ncbi:MAG TPA: acetyl-CoA carboxylase biotin carboxylase subunit [Acidobacteriaceae bacterium]|nr:acetyl-CoA carboxylase biotin carboxylase subunit [Acidobacteriaceae bacterium]
MPYNSDLLTNTHPRPFRKILIANRGEIALRIARACREMGIPFATVYSDADRAALHVLESDEAHRLGPAPATESYLRGDLLLDIARNVGADAIHPGYGFLSENADFAETCEQAEIKFIGPPSAAMRALGSKTRARQAADKAGMPRTPGSTTGLASLQQAVDLASEIGYPVMLKAAAGGGGKGMRAVTRPEDLRSAFETAQSEAERAFGSNEVYIEKLIERPRHIEIQVLADEHGHCIYLGERECSVQRRHQKVIEEAPSAVIKADLRRQIGEAAVRLAKSAGYTNAGTVEFLLDDEDRFYFLEVNTRLQVEHPVTELVTGLDLVQLQIRIAQGEPLPIAQDDVRLRGHAIECRIYAEDPDNGFFPSPGKITRLLQPGGPGVREDSGIYEGWTVPMDYDPMLSKLIAYAPTRGDAIARMLRALDEYVICGIRTNLGLFRRILNDPDFQAARIDTGYLDRLLADAHHESPPERCDDQRTLATIAAAVLESHRTTAAPAAAQPTSAWKRAAREEGLRR